MKSHESSEAIEARELLSLVRFDGARVLDIGAGDGRYTVHFGMRARLSVLLDPDRDELTSARQSLAADGITRFAEHCGAAERLPYANDSFDLAVFSWSL